MKSGAHWVIFAVFTVASAVVAMATSRDSLWPVRQEEAAVKESTPSINAVPPKRLSINGVWTGLTLDDVARAHPAMLLKPLTHNKHGWDWYEGREDSRIVEMAVSASPEEGELATVQWLFSDMDEKGVLTFGTKALLEVGDRVSDDDIRTIGALQGVDLRPAGEAWILQADGEYAIVATFRGEILHMTLLEGSYKQEQSPSGYIQDLQPQDPGAEPLAAPCVSAMAVHGTPRRTTCPDTHGLGAGRRPSEPPRSENPQTEF